MEVGYNPITISFAVVVAVVLWLLYATYVWRAWPRIVMASLLLALATAPGYHPGAGHGGSVFPAWCGVIAVPANLFADNPRDIPLDLLVILITAGLPLLIVSFVYLTLFATLYLVFRGVGRLLPSTTTVDEHIQERLGR